jgi:predicted unusual protein kinase regulating ubiquinone biosynthesis (AarF/ABC1/UbiB family)
MLRSRASSGGAEVRMSSDGQDQGNAFPSRRARFAKLAGMTASIAAGYAKTAVKTAFQSAEDAARERARSYAESGERIAQTLGELKGAAMKLGQMASLQSDLLPRELSEALQKLQKEAQPMPYGVVAEVIRRELGSAPESLFSRFDQAPFASASIGQVHRARTDDGREVVVKVQYPEVDTSVDSDLAHLKLALRASGMVRGTRANLDALFEEIRARLHEELDYGREADNLREFGAFHARHDFIVVPKVVGERSAARVLTLTHEGGANLNHLDADPAFDRAARDRIGQNLFRLVLEQLFVHGSIHADPNPANFAFRPDGTIVLYDFGCVKVVRPEIRAWWARTLLAAFDREWPVVERGLLALGARRPDGPPIEPEYYALWTDALLGPLVTEDEFDYGTAAMHEAVVKLVPGILKRQASFQPPVELIFIDRVVGGHYGNMRKLRARGRFVPMVRPYLERAAAAVPLPG